MYKNHRFYLTYIMNGKYKETDELLSKADALLEKAELEADRAKDVQIVKYSHLLLEQA